MQNKTHFRKYRLQCFSSENVLAEYTKIRLEVNGKQSMKLRNGFIKFNSRSKLAVSSKIYGDFESVLNRVQKTNRDDNAYQGGILCSFAYNRFSKPPVLYRGKNAVYKFMT